jgi:hypothetical protein
MVKVFGEDYDSHPLETDLSGYASAAPATCEQALGRSVCLNIREDAITPEANRKSFVEFWEKSRSRNKRLEFKAICEGYRSSKVHTGKEFEHAKKIDTGSFDPRGNLIRVLKLSGLFQPLKDFSNLVRADGTKELDDLIKEFAGFPDELTEFNDWLTGRLKPPAYTTSLKAILDALAIIGQTQPYEPCWATTEDAFWRFVKQRDEADLWWKAVGLEPPLEGDWLVLVAYPAGGPAWLGRACQLFAGWNGLHYPAMKQCQWGYAMEVFSTSGDAEPLPELIHPAMALRIDDWRRAGSIPPQRIGAVPDYSVDSHEKDREHHGQKLSRIRV